MLKNKRVDPRVIRSQRLLKSALIALVAEKGFSNLSVGQIAERATLNRATFYLHYRDKTHLLMDAFEELMEQATPLPPEEGLLDPNTAQYSIEHVFNHIAQNADFFRVMLAEESVPEFANRFRRYVQDIGLRWLTALQPDEEKIIVSREIAIHFIGSAYLGVIIWWLQNDMPHPAEYMASQFLYLTAQGLQRSLGLDIPSSFLLTNE